MCERAAGLIVERRQEREAEQAQKRKQEQKPKR
jgi:hypothetical protein